MDHVDDKGKTVLFVAAQGLGRYGLSLTKNMALKMYWGRRWD